VRLPELFRTSIFRLTAFFALGSAASSLILFGFIYWQTAVYEKGRITRLLMQEADIITSEPTDRIKQDVETNLAGDFHRATFAALFDAKGEYLVGNLSVIPKGLPSDGKVHDIYVDRNDDAFDVFENILAVARPLPDHGTLIIGRSIVELQNLRTIVTRSLLLGVFPAAILAILAGVGLSLRTQRRIVAANQTVARIMRGNLRERLPVKGTSDDFDRLTISVNRMLDEIERLVNQIRGVTDNIAHDLRTPLTRMHTRLIATRNESRDPNDIDDVVDRALTDLNLTLGIITALLRISEIEDGRRRAAFAILDMSDVVQTVADLYEPIAEEKNLEFDLDMSVTAQVRGDRELLIEAVANLVDNAIKYTPAGGKVCVRSFQDDRGAVVIRVADSGTGIPQSEYDAVFQRFYRSRATRHIQGHGLGLSLVQAIAHLHNFAIQISDGRPGAIFDLVCQIQSEQSAA
jgi:signal transduction histidine kinase